MRRLVILTLASVAVLAAACGDDKDPTAPAVDPLVARYALTTINGQPLPYQFRPDSFVDEYADTLVYNERWSKDVYDLKANGRFENSYSVALTLHSVSGATEKLELIIDETLLGKWERVGSEVRLIADSVVYNGLREPLEEPYTSSIPLAAAGDFTVTGTRGHESLGPNPTVFIDYALLYKRQ
jgi:hypothetical protein